MTDKIHENWKKQGIPTWRDGVRPEYQSISQIAAPLMQQEIDSLRQRVKELEVEPFATMTIREDCGATFSGLPTGVIFKPGDTFTLYKVKSC